MSNSGANFESLLPESVETNRIIPLGNIQGKKSVSFKNPGTFTATLTGATEIEPTEIPNARQYFFKIKPEGYTLTVKGINKLGSEVIFPTSSSYGFNIIAIEESLYLFSGLEGSEGKAGNTILFGESTPAESLGVSGNFYIRTESGKAKYIYGPKVGSTEWGIAVELRGEKGEKGAIGPSGPSSVESIASLLYEPLSGIHSGVLSESSVLFNTAKKARFRMLIIPKACKIPKVWVRNGSTAAGKTRVGILDTGANSVLEYSLITQSAEVSQTGTKTWQPIELPEHSYSAGQVIMIGVMNSTSEGTYGLGKSALEAGVEEWPEGSIPGVSVVLPKLLASHTYATFEFSSVLVAGMEVTTNGGVGILAKME